MKKIVFTALVVSVTAGLLAGCASTGTYISTGGWVSRARAVQSAEAEAGHVVATLKSGGILGELRSLGERSQVAGGHDIAISLDEETEPRNQLVPADMLIDISMGAKVTKLERKGTLSYGNVMLPIDVQYFLSTAGENHNTYTLHKASCGKGSLSFSQAVTSSPIKAPFVIATYTAPDGGTLGIQMCREQEWSVSGADDSERAMEERPGIALSQMFFEQGQEFRVVGSDGTVAASFSRGAYTLYADTADGAKEAMGIFLSALMCMDFHEPKVLFR